jgi:hypothetical protein
MTLRLATEQDWPEVLRMARSFYEASPYNVLDFSEVSCRSLFDKYLSGNKSDLIIILSDAPGMIIGHSSATPFSTKRVASELAWWIDEGSRGTRDALLLFKAYEDWSVRIGATICQMAMLDESTNLEKFYLKNGYRPAERSFIKEL